jgi:hypothetical protein
VDANGCYPVKGAAPLMCGGIFQHRFGEHFVERLYFWRRQDEVDLRPYCRLRVFKEKKMVTLHWTILGSGGRIPFSALLIAKPGLGAYADFSALFPITKVRDCA